MTISEYIQKNKDALPAKYAEMLLQETSIWTNDACYGYMIIAMKNAGYSSEEISDMIHYLHSAFEDYTIEEAEKKWKEY